MTSADRLARVYIWSNRKLEGGARLAKALQDALWLGFAERELLHAIDVRFYARKGQYFDAAYNTGGLWGWEQEMVEKHFSGCHRLVVTSAGGGREVLALNRKGFYAVGFECNADMVDAGTALLRDQGLEGRLLFAPRDGWPSLQGHFDGVVIGWGSIMHIHGRAERVAFLRTAREHVGSGAPLLISFFVTSAGHSYYRVVRRVGSLIRRLRGRPPVDFGDGLIPSYCHSYTRETLTEELAAAGFDIIDYSTEGYGHAVALAR